MREGRASDKILKSKNHVTDREGENWKAKKKKKVDSNKNFNWNIIEKVTVVMAEAASEIRRRLFRFSLFLVSSRIFLF